MFYVIFLLTLSHATGNSQEFDRHPKIGDNVFIGCHVNVLGNINIGRYCKIGAGSLVLKSIPAGSVAVGTPAIVVKSFIPPGGLDGEEELTNFNNEVPSSFRVSKINREHGIRLWNGEVWQPKVWYDLDETENAFYSHTTNTNYNNI